MRGTSSRPSSRARSTPATRRSTRRPASRPARAWLSPGGRGPRAGGGMRRPPAARREARFREGELVLLADQDPSLWNTAQIAAGRAALDRALALRGRGPYVVQAAIAALHADEPRDWPQIAALYGELARITDSPVVELSRAVAVAEHQGPEAGLDIVDRLALDDYHYLHATRGE